MATPSPYVESLPIVDSSGSKKPTATHRKAGRFPVFLVRTSHYDNEGYVIRWRRSLIPSNTLATLYGLVTDCAERHVLGENVEIECHGIDEANTRIDLEKIIQEIRSAGGGLVGFVGVQSNQYPRVMDLTRVLREAGISVSIGGFHVSGCLAMLPGVQPDLQEAIDLGVSLFAGEAEGRLDEILIDAANGALKPIYNHLKELPSLEGQPFPFVPRNLLERTFGFNSSFDSGRGCPFHCSFCTIINVQGRKSRRRSADDIEAVVRANHAQGVTNFLVTDDNFARNKEWKSVLNRLIKLRKEDKLKIKMMIQVDALCRKIPGFIKKSRKAGVNRVFVGLESINPDALKGTGKRQNHISEYREMLQAWHDRRVIIDAGYILGFPGDTRESILEDIKTIKRNLPVDMLEFQIMTPLPGSQDHKELFHAGIAMDPDMNNYDLQHVTTAHPKMSAEEWQEVYHEAWAEFYSPEHMKTILRRGRAARIASHRMMTRLLWFRSCTAIEKQHPLDGGLLRVKSRHERRPGMPKESVIPFYARRAWDIVSKQVRFVYLYAWLAFFTWRLYRDPETMNYRDAANGPVNPDV